MFKLSSIPDRIENAGLLRGGEIAVPGEKLPQLGREPTTNTTHIWRRVRDSNPGHIGGRRALSPLRHPCSLTSLVWNLNNNFKEKYCQIFFIPVLALKNAAFLVKEKRHLCPWERTIFPCTNDEIEREKRCFIVINYLPCCRDMWCPFSSGYFPALVL